MTHCMKLQAEPFAMIKSGRKTYELRLHDEKRRAIVVGDEILFSHAKTGETIHCIVTSLRQFSTFAALYAALPLCACGYTEETVKSASPEDMARYYKKEDEMRYGVLAIEIRRS